MTVRFRGAGSIELAADASGRWDGPVCLLLHGGGQTRHAWGGTTRALGDAGFLALTLDQRGHGDSDWAPDADYSPDAYAADLRAVLEQIGRPAALVGASLGGLAALLAAGEIDRLRLVFLAALLEHNVSGHRARTGRVIKRQHGFLP